MRVIVAEPSKHCCEDVIVMGSGWKAVSMQPVCVGTAPYMEAIIGIISGSANQDLIVFSFLRCHIQRALPFS